MSNFDKFLKNQIIYNNGLFEDEIKNNIQIADPVISINDKMIKQVDPPTSLRMTDPATLRKMTNTTTSRRMTNIMNSPKMRNHMIHTKNNSAKQSIINPKDAFLSKKEGITLAIYAIILLTLSWSYFFFFALFTPNIEANSKNNTSNSNDSPIIQENNQDNNIEQNGQTNNINQESSNSSDDQNQNSLTTDLANKCQEIKNGVIVNEKINLNKSNLTQLQIISGVGPSTAQKIIDYRTSNGSFSNIEELMEVSGIGEKTFEKIKDKICV